MPLIAALAALPALAHAAPSSPTLVAGSAKAKAGYTIAGPQGAEWTFPGGPRVAAAPGTLVRVLSAPQPLTLGPGGTTAGYTVILKSGKLAVEISKDAKSAVIITTPRQLNAIVKNGRARAVASDSETAVANDLGETLTSVSGGAFRPLAEGMVHVGSTGVRPLIASPSSVQGKRLLFSTAGESSVKDISWNDVPDATGYRVELSKSGKNRPFASAETRSSHLDQTLAELEPGAYEMRLFSLDATGLAGTKPMMAPIRVVGAELPEGAYLDASGAIRLGKGQRVKFLGVEGLEMSYGKARQYVQASSSAGLFRDEPTVVHFRLPGSRDIASARLAPRTVRARIELGPRTATWPKDSISIRVKLEDPNAEVPAWLEAVPKVSIGIESVAVPFKKSGGWLTAKLAPRPGDGPWVVRVEVEDQFGTSLGRDFVEVIHGASRGKRSVRVGLEAKR